MKASFPTILVTGVVVFVSALSETRASRLHPEALARFEAITSYCERADPVSESEYRSKLAGLLLGHSEEEVQRSRTTESYRRAMIQAAQTLAQVSLGTGVKACSEFLAGE